MRHSLLWILKNALKLSDVILASIELEKISKKPRKILKAAIKMLKLILDRKKKKASKELKIFNARLNEDGNKEKETSRHKCINNLESLKMLLIHFQQVGNKSKKCLQIFMKLQPKSFMKWSLQILSKRPNKPKKTSSKVLETLKKVREKLRVMLKEKLNKLNLKLKEQLAWNLKRQHMRTLRKQQHKDGKISNKEPKMFTTRLHKL